MSMKFSEWKQLRESVASELKALRAERASHDQFAANLKREREVDRLATRYFLASDRAYVTVLVASTGEVKVVLTKKDGSRLGETSCLVSRLLEQHLCQLGFTREEHDAGLARAYEAERWVAGDGDLLDGITLDFARRPWLT